MELPQCGKQCSVADCKQLDFLPLECACKLLFCRAHFAEHVDTCSAQREVKQINVPGDTPSYTCSRQGCREKSIVPLVCAKCNQHFCISHRHIAACDEVDDQTLQEAIDKCNAPKIQFQEAKATVDKEIENTLRHAKRKETAHKVQLMRLKAKALGQKSIPLANRLYFTVYNTKYCSAGVPTFVAYDWTVGRTVDAMADACKIPNNNNKPSAPKLRLYRHSDSCILTDNMSERLGDLVRSSFIVNGDCLVLDYEC